MQIMELGMGIEPAKSGDITRETLFFFRFLMSVKDPICEMILDPKNLQ